MSIGDPLRPEMPSPVGPAADPLSGFRTTEFWLSLAGIAAGVVLIVCGHVEIGGAVLATVIPGYALARGASKARKA